MGEGVWESWDAPLDLEVRILARHESVEERLVLVLLLVVVVEPRQLSLSLPLTRTLA